MVTSKHLINSHAQGLYTIIIKNNEVLNLLGTYYPHEDVTCHTSIIGIINSVSKIKQ